MALVFFVFCETAAAAVRVAFRVQQLSREFPSWLRAVAPSRYVHEATVVPTMGIHTGSLLLLRGDYFGDPVNVSSKLGEDLAEPGDLFISHSAFTQVTSDKSMAEIINHVTTEVRKTEISNVELDYVKLSLVLPVDDVIGAAVLPSWAVAKEHVLSASGSDVDPLAEGNGYAVEETIVMTTDLSGFTKLTKKYGILHFLRILFSAREIIVPLVKENRGRVIKYEGDNIIAKFDDAIGAMACVREVRTRIDSYNKDREKDFQIRMGIALDKGEVLVQGHDICGKAFANSFHLAEEVAECGEVLLTADFLRESAAVSEEGNCAWSERRSIVGNAGATIEHHNAIFS